MFIGCIDHFMVFNEYEFACRKCGYIHFENMWQSYYKKDFEKFELRCLNHPNCRTYLIVIKVDNYMLVTEKKIETILYKTNKIEMLAKRVDVQKHVKRYEGVDINDKLALIEALKQMVEDDQKQMIIEMRNKLELLEKGEIPAPEQISNADRPKRTRKKKDQHQEEDQISDEL